MQSAIHRFAVVATVLSAMHACAAQADERIAMIAGGIDKLIYLPLKLADTLGYYKDEGLDVELESQPAGVDAENELLAGAVQAVAGFYDHSIDLQARGKDVVSIVVFGLVPGSAEMVRADEADRIRSMGDVKGKTLGVTGLGSSSMFLGRYLAARHGLKPADYAMLPVGAGNSLIAAFKQKRVDVAWTTEPTTSLLRASGAARVLVDLSTVEGTEAALGGLYPASCLYVERSWAVAHEVQAGKLARAIVRALRFMQTHSAEEIAAQMPADYYGGSKALYVQALKASMPMYSRDGKMPDGGPETVLRVLAGFNANIKGKHVDLSRTYTNEFVNRVGQAD